MSSHKEPKHCTLNKHDINKSFKKKQSPRPSFNFSTAKLFSFLHNMQFITSFHKVLKGTSAKDKKDSCFFSSLFVFLNFLKLHSPIFLFHFSTPLPFSYSSFSNHEPIPSYAFFCLSLLLFREIFSSTFFLSWYIMTFFTVTTHISIHLKQTKYFSQPTMLKLYHNHIWQACYKKKRKKNILKNQIIQTLY